MIDKLEEIRTSERGKILFYLLLGFVIGFLVGCAGHDNTFFSNNYAGYSKNGNKYDKNGGFF